MNAVTEATERALSIPDAAEASGLSADTLRYYERTGLLEPVSRNGSGHRRYRAADLERSTFLAREGRLELVEWKISAYKERLGRG